MANNNTQVVEIDILRSLAFAGINGSTFSPIGTPFTNPIRLICITNNTDGDMFFSDDGINAKLFVPLHSFKLFDLNTNRTNRDQLFCLQSGTQISAKFSTAPSIGAVYVEALWGQ
jgi:hypothetical protein